MGDPDVTQGRSKPNPKVSAEGCNFRKLRGAQSAALPTVIVSDRYNREPNDLRPELHILANSQIADNQVRNWTMADGAPPLPRVVWHEVAHWLGFETEEQVEALHL